MMKILQLVLVFSEIFIQSSCLLIRQYHYISNPLNWTEAQTYCRQNYIDLATIESSEEMDKFLKAIERPTELESTVKTNSRFMGFLDRVEPEKHSLKLRLKINSPVNLNDPAVKAELLKKFQKELTDKGVSGVKLKWTEQRDGNVFQKEESKTNSAL
ncbi:hypothetical protein OJAV_G00178910 [Oryzias javanicus]|uniref:C-type lectin domain-containing protein n=1 Tax=Oryzias javanicus TaxID=123683 RepID=A0A3S2NZ69_ORYJA|nr:hypothetical protein OJAV_G00178910 [Oryzias javanicus]